jgi:phosphoribosylanthranilate isomerase
MFIKVCGVTSREQIDWAMELGYSAIGVVIHPGSPRFCDHQKALDLAAHARGKIATVAVGVSFDEVKSLYADFDLTQIYEYKKLKGLIFAGTDPPSQSDFDYFLYDAGKGSGRFRGFPDWLQSVKGKLIISGGLNHQNVGRAIRETAPFGVDVSSGVEVYRGRKDFNLMKEFIDEVKDACN